MSTPANPLLAAIAASLGGDRAVRCEAVARRLAARAPGPLPASARCTPEEAAPLFAARAGAAAAVVESIAAPGTLPSALRKWLAEWQLAPELVASDDPLLRTWLAPDSRCSVRFGSPLPSDRVGVVLPIVAVAESGTLVLGSGATHPTALAFLPDYLVAILPRSRIVPSCETALERVGSGRAERSLPRCINFVTGPSRTADIEEVLLLGAHGPRTLLVLVVDNL
jgi:L-lactate dehydrogenase complex protein LldG